MGAVDGLRSQIQTHWHHGQKYLHKVTVNEKEKAKVVMSTGLITMCTDGEVE